MKTMFFFLLSFSLFNLEAVSKKPGTNHDHFLVHAVPKCGLHFIQKTIKEITGESCFSQGGLNQEILSNSKHDERILCVHGPYTKAFVALLKSHDIRLISMIRDPRDALVSLIFHLRHFKGTGSLRDFFYVVPNFDDMSFDQQLTSVMTHPDPAFNYIEYYKARVKWRTFPGAYSVRYENLVGSQGGGDDTLQLVEVINICRYIGLKVSVDECRLIAGRIYNQHNDEVADGKVFHHAQIGSWKEFFTEAHKKLAKKHLGQLLVNLGYEKDFDW